MEIVHFLVPCNERLGPFKREVLAISNKLIHIHFKFDLESGEYLGSELKLKCTYPSPSRKKSPLPRFHRILIRWYGTQFQLLY